MNRSICSAWGSHPANLALLSLRKEYPPKATGTTIAHARPNDNTIDHFALYNQLFETRAPLGYQGHFIEIQGRGLGAERLAVIAVDPHTGSRDKDELGCPWGAESCRSGFNSLEELRPVLCQTS